MSKTTLGLIVGNRGFFPSHLCQTGRDTILRVLKAEGFDVIALTPADTTFGSVESRADATACADGRSGRPDPRLCRRGADHRRRVEDVRRVWRGPHSKPAGPAAAHLPASAQCRSGKHTPSLFGVRSARFGLACAALLLAAGCARFQPRAAPRPALEREPFGALPDGRAVTAYTLRNGRGLEARILDYGGIILSLSFPDRDGRATNVVLRRAALDDYVLRGDRAGALGGRFAGRIAFGTFTLDGREVSLPTNLGRHHAHGGDGGFDRQLWTASAHDTPEGPQLRMDLVSPDGDQGYPGRLTVSCVYTLTAANGLRVRMTARTDRSTVVSLTRQDAFNLAGAGSSNVLAHVMTLASDRILETDTERIPTGRTLPVDGTPFDFRRPRAIGDGLAIAHPARAAAGGYDCTWIADRGVRDLRQAVARVYDPASGRVLEVFTTLPAVQVCVQDGGEGVDGRGSAAFRIAPQGYPDAPNRPEFPTAVLRPGMTYDETIEYRFSTLPQ